MEGHEDDVGRGCCCLVGVHRSCAVKRDARARGTGDRDGIGSIRKAVAEWEERLPSIVFVRPSDLSRHAEVVKVDAGRERFVVNRNGKAPPPIAAFTKQGKVERLRPADRRVESLNDRGCEGDDGIDGERAAVNENYRGRLMELRTELEDLDRKPLLKPRERGLEPVVSLMFLRRADSKKEDDLVGAPRRRQRSRNAARVGGIQLDAHLYHGVVGIGEGEVLRDRREAREVVAASSALLVALVVAHEVALRVYVRAEDGSLLPAGERQCLALAPPLEIASFLSRTKDCSAASRLSSHAAVALTASAPILAYS